MIHITGTLLYSPMPTWRAAVWLEKDFGDYYCSLIPKYKDVQPQRWRAHVTVVRVKLEVPLIVSAWGKYANEEVEIAYDPEMKTDGTYFWLDAWSERIGEIRRELGLPTYRSKWDRYHITVANVKEWVK